MSLLQLFILDCWDVPLGAVFEDFAERHSFINALRSGPFPSPPEPFSSASALQAFILFF